MVFQYPAMIGTIVSLPHWSATGPGCWSTLDQSNRNGGTSSVMAISLLRTEGSLGNTAHAVLRTPFVAATPLSVLTDVDKGQNAGDG